MEEFETIIRFGSFLGAFALFALLEGLFPDRMRKLPRRVRWSSSFLLVIISGVLTKLALPLGLSAIAVFANSQSVGLFNTVSVMPDWVVFLICFVLMDFAIWIQHVVTHKVPFLWRLHRVHHTDPDVDASTAFRFHPVEIILSLGWKSLIVLAIGAPVAAVFWFQVVLNASAQFNHANMKLPDWLDKKMRLIIVTPDMHRIHHSIDQIDSDTNYGFFLSIWDRLSGAYSANFVKGINADIGQESFQNKADQRGDKLLLQPFKSDILEGSVRRKKP